MYEGVHHVSLVVTDLKKALYFYEGILGFSASEERPQFAFPGVWYDFGGTQLHLITNPKGKALRGTDELDSRDGHFAVRVKDIPRLLKKLDHHHIPYLNKPENKTPWHQVYVSDPDGNLIEFNGERQSVSERDL
ncbi:VOC family protein [Fictibacillus terranigra]|uniref:VOC family protein n=1 Tax=Fictibacillus terranigra TaxID=3058424 RepID=A0ABT8E3P2_9BACL|nr:VOC family protein [Fictibacillus sp. CENA-BCM004]MDN4072524.1 VOC family protein [Fictibacillus sp. CENA-BCM004]